MVKKELYIVTIELDADSIYFSEMTGRQAAAMRQVLKRGSWKFSIQKVRGAPGFNKYADLMASFADQVS